MMDALATATRDNPLIRTVGWLMVQEELLTELLAEAKSITRKKKRLQKQGKQIEVDRLVEEQLILQKDIGRQEEKVRQAEEKYQNDCLEVERRASARSK